MSVEEDHAFILETCEEITLYMCTMATHSSRIPWKEEPGGLQSMESQRVDTTEQLHFHFSLPCIGEGNGNPLQCSCLESPRDRGAWWAAFYAVAQNWTQLKRLSSSSICQMDIADVNKLRTRWGYYPGQVDKMKLQGSV